jgi:two-component system NtrC family sensor kinase
MQRDPATAAGDSPQQPCAPSTEALLEGVLTLGREVHLEMPEPALVRLFLSTLHGLFPGRVFAIRVIDPELSERPRCYAVGSVLRAGLDHAQLTVKASAVDKTRLARSWIERARVRLDGAWDSPFPGIGAGFAVPLVASGECYGVLDVGYPGGPVSACGDIDEPLLLPIANQLSVALRNQRLHRDAAVLRDYQAKLIEHANALIVGMDKRWRITVWNQALCGLTGYSQETVLGRDVREILLGKELPALARQLRFALAGGHADSVEVTLLASHGRRVRTVWSVAGISGSSGAIEAVVAVGHDQTRLRELQGQIIHAEKLATLGQIAASVIHELNNPLTSIAVYAEYLRGKLAYCLGHGTPLAVAEEDVEKLRRIGAGAQRITKFTRDLMHYARPTRDEIEAVHLDQVVLQALSLCEHMFEHGNLRLARELAGDLPPVPGVPGQIEQVVVNLVTNAVHAITGDGAGTVTVGTRRLDTGHVAITVSDTGAGISPEARERIFEPFFTTKADGRGMGLGLSIVRSIIEEHHGTIEVADADGGGALFVIRLPATSV